MDLTITISDSTRDLLDALVASGDFATRAEAVGAALALLASERELAGYDVAALRAAVQEGIDSGDAGELDFEEIRREGQAILAARKAQS